MTRCKYTSNRGMPISVNPNESFQNINPDYFFMCLVEEGYALLNINGIRCCITPGVLMCYDNSVNIEIVSAHDMKATSITFAPQFINVNLNWNVVRSNTYALLCKEYNYPAFSFLLCRNQTYNGLIPLGTKQKDRLMDLFTLSVNEVNNQPDQMWSCRTRTNILDIFDIGEYLYERLTSPPNESEHLVNSVIEYIHINISNLLTLDKICEEFRTNHTTLGREFKCITGFSIIEYVIRKRVHLVSDSLAFTELRVEEIAEKYGFFDVSHLNKAFKKYTGTTPLKYRKSALEKRIRNPYNYKTNDI